MFYRKNKSYKQSKSAKDYLYTRYIEDFSTGCWNWTMFKDKNGYGDSASCKFDNGHFRAHRLSYYVHYGQIPKGMFVCHSCDNPSCINPSHLFLGTALDNQLDCIKKNRNRPAIGQNNPSSKLTNDKVKYIRENKGKKSNVQLGKELGVSDSLICNVQKRKIWTHVN